ncbi:Hypp2339 [Branchiostoma lanceolatum]|uniref:Hypp2339 protein n=1 Tax=Branchiostoma lanceolatum TaxID=7740 RepID=A0A8J9ZPZ9_BRALA|nr:Hypp2339 [Branchiostoma lanceolatum]
MAEDQSFSALQSSLWREGTFKVVYCPRNEPVPPDPDLTYEVSVGEYRGLYADLRGAREQVHRQDGEIARLRQQTGMLTDELRHLTELLRRAEAERDGYLRDLNNLWDLNTDTEGTDVESEDSPELGTVEVPQGSRRPSVAARRLSVASRKISDGSEENEKKQGLASDFLGSSNPKTAAKSPEKIKRALKASYEKKKNKEIAKVEAGYEKIISQLHKEREKLQQQFSKERDKLKAQIKDMTKQLRSRKAEKIVYTQVPRHVTADVTTQTDWEKRDVYEAVRTVVAQVKELKKENVEMAREKDKAARHFKRKVDVMKARHEELLQTKVSLEKDVKGLRRKVAFYEARQSYRNQALPSVSPERRVGGTEKGTGDTERGVGVATGKRDSFVEENLLEGSRRNSMRSMSVVSAANSDIPGTEGRNTDVSPSPTQQHGKNNVKSSVTLPRLPLVSVLVQNNASPQTSKNRGGQLATTRLSPHQQPVKPTVATAMNQQVARQQMSKYRYQQRKSPDKSPGKHGVMRLADSEAARRHNSRNVLRPLLNSSVSQASARRQPGVSQASARRQPGVSQASARRQPGVSQASARRQPGVNQVSAKCQPGVSQV